MDSGTFDDRDGAVRFWIGVGLGQALGGCSDDRVPRLAIRARQRVCSRCQHANRPDVSLGQRAADGPDVGDFDYGDFDGDSDLDIIVVGSDNLATKTITMYENDGSGNFSNLGHLNLLQFSSIAVNEPLYHLYS